MLVVVLLYKQINKKKRKEFECHNVFFNNWNLNHASFFNFSFLLFLICLLQVERLVFAQFASRV